MKNRAIHSSKRAGHESFWKRLFHSRERQTAKSNLKTAASTTSVECPFCNSTDVKFLASSVSYECQDCGRNFQ